MKVQVLRSRYPPHLTDRTSIWEGIVYKSRKHSRGSRKAWWLCRTHTIYVASVASSLPPKDAASWGSIQLASMSLTYIQDPRVLTLWPVLHLPWKGENFQLREDRERGRESSQLVRWVEIEAFSAIQISITSLLFSGRVSCGQVVRKQMDIYLLGVGLVFPKSSPLTESPCIREMFSRPLSQIWTLFLSAFPTAAAAAACSYWSKFANFVQGPLFSYRMEAMENRSSKGMNPSMMSHVAHMYQCTYPLASAPSFPLHQGLVTSVDPSRDHYNSTMTYAVYIISISKTTGFPPESLICW